MRREDFKKLPNFTYQEMLDHYRSKGYSTWGAKQEIAKVKFSFMKKLQKFRTLIGRPVFFNSLTDGKHVKGSVHYLAIAGDIWIGGKGKLNFNKLFQYAIDAGFQGIGYYPFWNRPGFHLDDRKNGFKCWLRNKAGQYVGLI